jgi:Holliday junction resolvase RusA-like endonuclease
MPSISFKLQVKPVSINDAYYRAGQLKAGSRQYRYELLTQLLAFKESIISFREQALDLINNAGYALNLHIVHLVPNDTFYNKKGQISMRSGDTDNYSKLLQDFLFNPRYCSDSASYSKDNFTLKDDQKPYNIGIDDRFIQTIVATKQPHAGDRWQIEIKVSVLPIVQTA